jgi:ribonuclease E
LQVLRALEEQLIKGATHNLIARTRPDVAQYLLNQKRAHLRSLEDRFALTITILADTSVTAPQAFVIDRGEQMHTIEAAKALAERAQAVAAPLEEEDDLEDSTIVDEDEDEAAAAPAMAPEHGEPQIGEPQIGEPQIGENGGRRRRRRRRGRGGRGGGENFHAPPHEQQAVAEPADEFAAVAEHEMPADDELAEQSGELAPQQQSERGEPRHDGERRRRRGRRGGRRNRHRNGERGSEGYDRGPRAPDQEFAPAVDGLISPPATEPELTHAVADLDAAPRAASPAPVSAAVPQPMPAEPEPARRRSTVRERAPIGGSEDVAAPSQSVAAAPEPVVTDVGETAGADRPRRTGWWSRRFAGGG